MNCHVPALLWPNWRPSPRTSTASPGLYAAGEDCGGVHGANRLGGNGVANSTVFGGLAGEAMAEFISAGGPLRDADETAIDAGIARAERPFALKPGDLPGLRDRLRIAAVTRPFQGRSGSLGYMRTQAGLDADSLAHQSLLMIREGRS